MHLITILFLFSQSCFSADPGPLERERSQIQGRVLALLAQQHLDDAPFACAMDEVLTNMQRGNLDDAQAQFVGFMLDYPGALSERSAGIARDLCGYFERFYPDHDISDVHGSLVAPVAHDGDAAFARALAMAEDGHAGGFGMAAPGGGAAGVAAFVGAAAFPDFGAEAAPFDRLARQQEEALDHQVAIMVDAIQNLPGVPVKIAEFLDQIAHSYVTASEEQRRMILACILNMRELPAGRTVQSVIGEFVRGVFKNSDGKYLFSSSPSEHRMRVVAAILDGQEQIRQEEQQRLAAEVAAAEAAAAQAAAAAAAAAIPAAPAYAAFVGAGDAVNNWVIPAQGATTELRFAMPAELDAEEQGMVRFFMNRVNPKLIALLAAGTITTSDYNYILRALSMAIAGHAYADLYRQEAEERMHTKLNGGIVAGYYPSLIDLSSVSGRAERLRAITDVRPLLAALVRRENHYQPYVTTFMTLHTEDLRADLDQLIGDYRARHPGVAIEHVTQGINAYGERVRARVIDLPSAVTRGFLALLDRGGTDVQWREFAQSFNTYYCYDGTLDRVGRAAGEIVDTLEGGAVAVRLHGLYGEIIAGDRGFAGKLPGYTDGAGVPGFTGPMDAFYLRTADRLPAILRVITDAQVRDVATVAQLNAAYGAFAPIFRGVTFQNIGVAPAVITRLYEVLGLNPGTRECKYSDEEIIELLFWMDRGSADSLMPPAVNTKYNARQMDR